ncbi:hypothetical protein [Rathayibacter tritici]|uniref:Bulb-type lectin domain-containing protein n=1 Tax=Rathayibacter tritici TaxID=33888 RepID=A0A169C0B9_9MICO|nr:hypothetical protein [Rathayibacter tritici]AND16745.1 hypothetical protein A6122_1610 [Rathayibacter tritici]
MTLGRRAVQASSTPSPGPVGHSRKSCDDASPLPPPPRLRAGRSRRDQRAAFGATPALAAENPQQPLSSSQQSPADLAPASDSPDATQQSARATVTYYDALVGGERLTAGQKIASGAGGYEFRMQSDGNAVTSDAQGRASFSTGTQGRGSYISMQKNGELVVYSARNVAVWSTTTTNEAGASVIIQGDGNLVVYRENGSPAWASNVRRTIPEPVTDTLFSEQNLRPVHQLTSADGRFRAVMQSDGNFVGYGPQGVVWSVGTSGKGNRVALQKDGNIVIYGADESVKWFSGTSGRNLRLGVNNAGSLILVDRDDDVLWTSQAAFPSSTLSAANSLEAGSFLRSANGVYRAVMQADGNFVLYGKNGPLWATKTSRSGAFFAIDTGGELAVGTETTSGWSAVPPASAAGPFRLVLQDDGNLVEYDSRRAVWSVR